MEATGLTHPDVQVALHRDEQNSRYLFGVVVDGEFIPLIENKLGRIDKWLRRASDRRAEQQQQQTTSAPQQQQTTQPPSEQ